MTKNIYPYFEDPACIIQVAEANGDEPGGKYAESQLYRLLQEQLPENWYCLYNVGFRGVDGDNQIDFLVIVPGWGIINLECKGQGYKPLENGNNFSHNTFFKSKRNFVEKARKACENRYKTICELWERENIGVYTGAVIFPTVDFKNDDGTPYNFDLNPIYTKKDIDIEWYKNGQSPLEKIILQCFDAAKQNICKGISFHVATLSKDDAERIFNEYKKTGNEIFHEIFNNALKNFNNTLESALDGYATFPLDFIFQKSPYIHITGAAGSGKTWLAQMAAERFLKENKDAKILYVCYNTMLAADLAANRFKDTKNICVANFHRLGLELFKSPCIINRTDDSKLMDENKTDENFINVWNGLSKSERPEKYDLILVDEAQDFNKTKIDFLCKIAKNKNRKIVFFSDKEQAMHETENWQLPQLSTEIKDMELKRNLRNSIQIHEYVETNLIKTGVESISTAQGPAPERCSASWCDIYHALTEALKTFDKSSIALISDLSEETIKSKLVQFNFLTKALNFGDTKKNLKTWRNKNKYIWLSTIKKFKGLEADVVFVILGQKFTSKAEQYVGATRAKYCLKIFELNE